MIESELLVLGTLKYNEKYNIVDCYSRSEGRVSFLVRIPRTRRAGIKPAVFQPLSLLEAQWNERPHASLLRLRTVRCAHPYASIPYNPAKSAMALFLAEFFVHSLGGDGDCALFDYIKNALLWLDAANSGVANFHLALLIRLSLFLGFSPNTSGYRSGSCFDLMNGCFVPAAPPHAHYLKPEEARLVPLFMRMDFKTLRLFRLSHTQRQRVLAVINEYYRLHLPSFPRLNSLDVLAQVFG